MCSSDLMVRRVIGISVIALIVLIRTVVLESHPLPPALEVYLFPLAWFLAPVTFLVSFVVFLMLVLTKKLQLSEQVLPYVIAIVGWAFAGLGIAAVIVVAGSAYYRSPQGPFSIVFLDGPLGAGVGTIVGFLVWLATIGKYIGWEIARPWKRRDP